MTIHFKEITVVSTVLIGLRCLPVPSKVPSHYITSLFVNYVASPVEKVVTSTPHRPTGWTHFSWPLRKIMGETARVMSYMVCKPLVSCSYAMEKIVRKEGIASLEILEKGVVSLKEHNQVFAAEVNQLEPTAELLFRLAQVAEQSVLLLEHQKIHPQGEFCKEEEQKQQEAQGVVGVEETTKALEKIAHHVQTVLSNPLFLKKFQLNLQRLATAEKNLEEAHKTLDQEQEVLLQTTQQLSRLQNRYGELCLEYKEISSTLTPQLEGFLKKTEPVLQNKEEKK